MTSRGPARPPRRPRGRPLPTSGTSRPPRSAWSDLPFRTRQLRCRARPLGPPGRTADAAPREAPAWLTASKGSAQAARASEDPVVMLAGFSGWVDGVRAQEAGARGHVLRAGQSEDPFRALRSAAAGGMGLAPGGVAAGVNGPLLSGAGRSDFPRVPGGPSPACAGWTDLPCVPRSPARLRRIRCKGHDTREPGGRVAMHTQPQSPTGDVSADLRPRPRRPGREPPHPTAIGRPGTYLRSVS
ncbi:hypothetical protein QFZ32_002140 [Streptomyces canus]|nr:hypothetical protein [Streptomyces canus]